MPRSGTPHSFDRICRSKSPPLYPLNGLRQSIKCPYFQAIGINPKVAVARPCPYAKALPTGQRLPWRASPRFLGKLFWFTLSSDPSSIRCLAIAAYC